MPRPHPTAPISGGQAPGPSLSCHVVSPEDINQMIQLAWPTAGARCTAVSATTADGQLEITDRDLRPGQIISGPTQFALADAALWFLAHGALDRVEPMAVTSELSIRFLRPARGALLYARAELDRITPRTLVGTVRVYSDAARTDPTAAAQGTYVLPAPTA